MKNPTFLFPFCCFAASLVGALPVTTQPTPALTLGNFSFGAGFKRFNAPRPSIEEQHPDTQVCQMLNVTNFEGASLYTCQAVRLPGSIVANGEGGSKHQEDSFRNFTLTKHPDEPLSVLNETFGNLLDDIPNGISGTLELPGFPMKVAPQTLNVTAAASDEVVGVRREFANIAELFESPFWKNILMKRSPLVAKSTVVMVGDTQSSYYFKASEFEDIGKRDEKEEDFSEDSEDLSEVSAALIRDNLKKLRPSRNVELVEVQYGDPRDALLPNVPVSYCVSAVLSSGGASYSQSYTWKLSLGISITPKLSVGIQPLGATFVVKPDALSLSFSTTGSINCNAPPGGKVQVFTSVAYKFFPAARKREVVYRNGKFDTGEWTPVRSENPAYLRFGAVFFDVSAIPPHQCVTKSEYLHCGSLANVLDMNKVNPLEGLLRASS